jgi:PEP-CTERM motif
MRVQRSKTAALGFFFLLLLAAGSAYALGGGGGHGDGRWDYAPPAAPSSSGGSSASTTIQQPSGSGGGNSSVGAVGAGLWCFYAVSDQQQAPVSVPEPLSAFLLGVGIIGLAVVRRKLST